MKKLLSLLIVLVVLISSIPCIAASGDIAGNIYYTDIKTTMYSAPVNALNIGGKTVIDAERLNWHYGFDVYWLADERKLDITDKGRVFVSLQAAAGETLDETKGKPGDIAGNYYYTDIKTYLNGKEIESYNIGGRTFIVAENMKDHGYDVVWNEEDRTLSISKNKDFYVAETELGDISLLYNPTYNQEDIFSLEVKRGVTIDYNEGTRYELATPSDSIMVTQSGMSYISLSDIMQIFNAECTLKENTETIVNGNDFEYTKNYYGIEITYDSNIKPGMTEVINYDAESIIPDLSNKKCEKITYDNVSIYINGENIGIPASYAGKVFQSSIFVIEGKIYVPTHIITKLLHCYSAM